MVNAPANLKMLEINPAKLRIYASKRISMTLPVSVSTQNVLPDGYSLQKITIIPSSVRVLVDSRLNLEQIRLETEPIDLQRISSSTMFETRVVPIAGVAFPDGRSPSVRVSIKVKKKS